MGNTRSNEGEQTFDLIIKEVAEELGYSEHDVRVVINDMFFAIKRIVHRAYKGSFIWVKALYIPYVGKFRFSRSFIKNKRMMKVVKVGTVYEKNDNETDNN